MQVKRPVNYSGFKETRFFAREKKALGERLGKRESNRKSKRMARETNREIDKDYLLGGGGKQTLYLINARGVGDGTSRK